MEHSSIKSIFPLDFDDINVSSLLYEISKRLESNLVSLHEKRCIWSIVTGGYLIDFLWEFYLFDLFDGIKINDSFLSDCSILFLNQPLFNYIDNLKKKYPIAATLSYKFSIDEFFSEYHDVSMVNFGKTLKYTLDEIFEQQITWLMNSDNDSGITPPTFKNSSFKPQNKEFSMDEMKRNLKEFEFLLNS
jgi:hypothetical protein